MLTLLKLWPWGLGLLAIIAVVGAFLSPVAALKLVKEVGQFLLERARGVVRWLRGIENWWQVGAVVLGVACVWLAFSVRNAKQEIILVTQQCDTRVLTIQGQVAAARSEARTASGVAADNRAALATCRAQLADEVGQRQDVDRLNREAVARARAEAEAARKDLATWQDNYRRRPATCEAALQALEAACPTIADY